MTTPNYKHLIDEKSEELKLPQWMSILTVNGFIVRNKGKVDEILDLGLNFVKLEEKDILYKKMLNNYLSNWNSDNIIEYFKSVDNLELINFFQNILHKEEFDIKTTRKILNDFSDLVFSDEKQNLILTFLYTDFKSKNITIWNKYKENPKVFLNKYSENIEIEWKKYYKVSSDYYAEYSFENNPDWEVVQLWKIKNNKFIWQKYKDLLENNEINVFWEENLDLILSISYTPKICIG